MLDCVLSNWARWGLAGIELGRDGKEGERRRRIWVGGVNLPGILYKFSLAV